MMSHRGAVGMFPPGTLPAFVLVTSLFALWGFANDITNPMVAAFKNVLLLSHFQSSLVQAAFYGGYCFMAIPAALFIRRFSYKGGILTGLALYSVGCFLFLPAGSAMDFGFFLAAYFVMTCGLAFLETTANPYILSLGPEETAARRLNFAQAFNPMGSLLGMFVAKDFILARLHPADEETRRVMAGTEPDAFAALVESDLSVIVLPYVLLGEVVLAVFIGFLLFRLPETRLSDGPRAPLLSSLARLFQTPRWLGGRCGAGVLRRCADHVMDLHHSIRSQRTRHDQDHRAGVEYRGHGAVCQQPVCLHMVTQIL